jgi:beta-glucosidase
MADTDDEALLRDVAASAMVLLRNGRDGDDGVPLPLDMTLLRTLCVVGPNSRTGQLNGGGSAIVRPRRPSHPLESLRDRLPATVDVRYAQGCAIDRTTPLLDPSLCGSMALQLSSNPSTDWTSPPDREHLIDTTKLLWFRDPFDRPGPPRFAARLRTTFVPDRSGLWKFGLRSVGDASMLVDGHVVIDNSDVPLPSIAALGKPEQAWEQDLAAGSSHDIEVRLVRVDGDDGLSAVLLTAAPPPLDDPIGEAVAAATGADVAVVIVGTNADWESEGRDRDDIALPGDQDDLVRRVAAVATTTIVVVNAGSPIAMPWVDDVDAVLVSWFPGEAFGQALVDVLLGEREPAGRLPITFPRSLDDTPTARTHPGTDGTSRYEEGRLIGHRWYEANGVEPLFAFGHGLGYGSVELVEAQLVESHRVRVWLENSGDRATRSCVQVYARRVPRAGVPVDETVLQLAGFARQTVGPATRMSVDVELHRRVFETWDATARKWRPLAGPFELRIGTSAADVPLTVLVDDRP